MSNRFKIECRNLIYVRENARLNAKIQVSMYVRIYLSDRMSVGGDHSKKVVLGCFGYTPMISHDWDRDDMDGVKWSPGG